MSARQATLIAIVTGAVASIALVLYAGRHNPSVILMLLFAGWVSMPFIVALWGSRLAEGWKNGSRVAFYKVVPALSLATVAIYGYAVLGQSRIRATPFFLFIPPASVLLSAIVVRFVWRSTDRLPE